MGELKGVAPAKETTPCGMWLHATKPRNIISGRIVRGEPLPFWALLPCAVGTAVLLGFACLTAAF